MGAVAERNDAERAYDHIRRGIIEGAYPPGARLVEAHLSAAVDVSRTPIREAIRRLASEGLVITERNRGAHVRPLDRDSIADLYEVRARLEGYGAELAAVRAGDDDIAVLRRAADRFERATTTWAREDANRDFHQGLLAASGHDRLPALVAGAVDAPLVFQALQRFTPAERDRSALFHHLIADAVGRGDGDRASRLMTEHILQGRDALLDRMTETAADDDRWLRSVR